MQSTQFYYLHLERVSRSFSFCIMQLPSPTREWIALSYLLFRIADTIEDTAWPCLETQLHQFAQFELFITQADAHASLDNWIEAFPTSLPEGEIKLIHDLPRLLLDLYSLPSEKQGVIRTYLQVMIAGMCHFQTNHRLDGSLRLSSLQEVNQYCFFVAGIVGGLLTYFFYDHIKAQPANEEILVNAYHFGLFLQKINLLKDRRKDELEGRHFVPVRAEVRHSLVLNAKHALQYIQALPVISGRPFRLFCAWSLFIGLASLTWIDKADETGKPYKISYGETAAIVYKLKRIIDDKAAVDALFERYLPSIEELSFSNARGLGKLPEWFRKVCPATLWPEKGDDLGLF